MAPICRNLLYVSAAFLLTSHVAAQEGDNEAEEGTCSAKNPESCNDEQKENMKFSQQLVDEGNALAGKEEYDKALKLYKMALQLDNTSSWSATPMVNAGLALKSLGKLDEGLDMMRQGVKLDPTMIHGQYNLGNTLAENKKWAEADAAYSAALLVATKDMVTHSLVAYIRLLMKLYHFEDGRAALDGRNIPKELGKLAHSLASELKKAEQPDIQLASLCTNALLMSGRKRENEDFGEWAVKKGIWKDVRQRSSNFDHEFAKGYKATPWWKNDVDLPDFLEEVSENWKKLAKEFDTLSKGDKLQPPEDTGMSDFQFYDKAKGHDWRQLELFAFGNKNFENAKVAKTGARILGDTQIKGDSFGRAFYSSMAPGTRTITRYGANNLRITCYLGLRVPNVEVEKLGIDVAGEVRGVKQGAWACFDDSFEHTIYNEADEPLGAVVVEFTHPAMPKQSKVSQR